MTISMWLVSAVTCLAFQWLEIHPQPKAPVQVKEVQHAQK